MTAKEFIEKERLEYSLAEYDEGGFLGIDERLLEQKLEEYHQAKLKLLDIANVEGQSEQCEHDYQPCKHEAVSEFDKCSKCGKII